MGSPVGALHAVGGHLHDGHLSPTHSAVWCPGEGFARPHPAPALRFGLGSPGRARHGTVVSWGITYYYHG